MTIDPPTRTDQGAPAASRFGRRADVPAAAVLGGALEAVVAVAVGAGALVVVALLTWAVQYADTVSWTVLLRAAADIWLLGHGVDIRFAVDAALADGAPWTGGLFGETARDLVYDLPERVRVTAASAMRGGAAATALLVAVSAGTVAVLLLVRFADVIVLMERLQPGVVGGLALTVGQAALLPTLVVWTLSWFAGPGFALGAGSSIGPFGVAAGPLPALPVLGALPAAGGGAFGAAYLLVPVAAGVLAGAFVMRRDGAAFPRIRDRLLLAVALGATAGVAALVLATIASGAAGPGRFAEVGPQPLLVAAAVLGEVAVGAAIGVLTARRRRPEAE